MGRPVKIRHSYVGERARLTRLEEAILRDLRLPGGKKDEIVVRLRELCGLLVQADDLVGKAKK